MAQTKRAARSSRKERAALERVMGGSQVQAAQAVGVSPTTIYRWERGDPDYWEHFERWRRKLISTTWGEAWLVLRQKLRSPDERVQLSAAATLISSIDRQTPSEQRINLTHEGRVEVSLAEVLEAYRKRRVRTDDG